MVDGQAGPCMGRSVHGLCMAWFHGMVCMAWFCDVVGVGKMHVCTTWISEVALGGWVRSGW